MQGGDILTNQEKILKWCGFELCHAESDESVKAWVKDGEAVYNLDMNFFVKYVVPNIDYFIISNWNKKKRPTVSLFNGEGKCFMASSSDPDEAWQEAVLEFIEK